jgi:hypothetical protein
VGALIHAHCEVAKCRRLATTMGTIDSSASARLMTVLIDRGIAFSEEEVQELCDSPLTGKDVEQWINEYLDEETLLSKDEFSLYVDCRDHV